MVSLQAKFALFPCCVWPRQPRTAANSHNAHYTSHKASILRQVWVPEGELERLDGGQTKAAWGRRGTLCWMHKPQYKTQCPVTSCSWVTVGNIKCSLDLFLWFQQEIQIALTLFGWVAHLAQSSPLITDYLWQMKSVIIFTNETQNNCMNWTNKQIKTLTKIPSACHTMYLRAIMFYSLHMHITFASNIST